MGDIIHALPAVAELRTAFPKVEIGWVIEERWVSLLSSAAAVHALRSSEKPLVDHIHVVNTRAWRNAMWSAETWSEIRNARRLLREKKYQLAIDFQGAWKSGFTSRVSGAPERYGFARTREAGAKLFYTRKIAAQGSHVVEQNLSLAAAIAETFGTGHSPVPTQNDHTRHASAVPDLLPRDAAVETWCEHALRTRGLVPGAFAILNPGAGWGAKCWPSERYAALARGLFEHGIRSVVNFGPAEENLARHVEATSEGAATAISCSISQLIAITRRARLFVGGDTGPMHMAAILRIPVVGIFGPTDPARNGPFQTESIVLRSAASVTDHSRTATPDQAMLSIEASEVLSASFALLERTSDSFNGPPEVTRG